MCGDAHGFQLFSGNELEVAVQYQIFMVVQVVILIHLLIHIYPINYHVHVHLGMWAFFGEEGGLDESSITFVDNTNIKIDCATRHSDSCSFDFDYFATLLNDGEDANVYVDTSGIGYNFEYGTEIGKCMIQ